MREGDVQAGLFPHLAHRCVRRRLVGLDHSPGRRPIITFSMAHEKNAPLIVEGQNAHRRDFDNRGAELRSQIPHVIGHRHGSSRRGWDQRIDGGSDRNAANDEAIAGEAFKLGARLLGHAAAGDVVRGSDDLDAREP